MTLASLSPAFGSECPVERAVYLADNRTENVPPDELRFSFESSPFAKPWDGFPTWVKIKSAELKRELVFDTYFTNNSGVQGVTATILEEDLPEHLREMRKHDKEEAIRRKEATERNGNTQEPDPLAALLEETDELEPLVLSSIVFVVGKDFEVAHFPTKGDTAPTLVLFPEFRPWAHSSNEGVVSSGIKWGVFRLDRCEW